MILEIKHVKKCRNNAYGNFHIRGHQFAQITISLKENKTLDEYMSTLLHEMLHAFTTLSRGAGFRVTNRREHKWIEACETALLRELRKIVKRRK